MLIVRDDRAQEGLCALCGRPVSRPDGPQLCLAGSLAAVCRPCGLTQDPVLCGLLDLARVAELLGRVSLHNPFHVPMEMLLDITRASENYYYSFTVSRGKAA